MTAEAMTHCATGADAMRMGDGGGFFGAGKGCGNGHNRST